MTMRLCVLTLAVQLAVLRHGTAVAQEPARNSLAQAQQLLQASKATGAGGLGVDYLPLPAPTLPANSVLGSVWEGDGMTFWFESNGRLSYQYKRNTASFKFTDGRWALAGANLHFTIPHRDIEIRAPIIANERIDTMAIPLPNNQGVVSTPFKIRKISP